MRQREESGEAEGGGLGRNKYERELGGKRRGKEMEGRE